LSSVFEVSTVFTRYNGVESLLTIIHIMEVSFIVGGNQSDNRK